MKSIEISKELLSEVLGDEYNDRLVDWFQIEDNYLRTYYDCGRYDYKGRPTGLGIEINIYELAHKCKEWTFSKGYIISSGLIPVLGVNKDGWAEVFSSSTPLNGKLHTFKQLSEPEAVIKASEYVLKEINEKIK